MVPRGAEQGVLGLEPPCAPQGAPQFDLGAQTASRRAFSHGFCTKSRAPRRIASTATSTVPHAVITTTGRVASSARSCGEQVEALRPRRRVARVVEIDQCDVVLAALDGREDGAGDPTPSTS